MGLGTWSATTLQFKVSDVCGCVRFGAVFSVIGLVPAGQRTLWGTLGHVFICLVFPALGPFGAGMPKRAVSPGWSEGLPSRKMRGPGGVRGSPPDHQPLRAPRGQDGSQCSDSNDIQHHLEGSTNTGLWRHSQGPLVHHFAGGESEMTH